MMWRRCAMGWALGMVMSSMALAQDPTGVWKGRWQSETTGHSGPMRARVTPRSDGSYDARFVGRFALVIPFMYKTTLTPIACDDCGTTVYAQKKLGPIMGSYQMMGNFGGSQFRAGFQAGKDSGTMNMSRIR